MSDERRINPRHEEIRTTLRIVGPAVLVCGLVLTAIGVISFFSMFASFDGPSLEFPRYFWCAFLGLPMTVIGLGISQFAFMGAVARYAAGEAAPVQKDAFNYLAEGTRPGVRTLAEAVGRGFAAGMGPPAATEGEARCPGCHAANPSASRYCNQCGGPLGEAACSKCGQPHAPGSKFCGHCGQTLADSQLA
jgi:hypothetical protein